MTSEAGMTLAILVVMFGMLIVTKLPPWVIFIGALTALMTLGLAPAPALLRGFSSPGVLTVGVLFMVAAGMYATGAIALISDVLIGVPRSLVKAQLKILPPIAIGSAFLNNTPLVAMMVPVIRDLSRATRLAASKLYMPLSFASILGGSSTLIGTSTNLIIARLVLELLASGDTGAPGMQELGIFTPTPVGLPAAVVGIIFLIFIGSRLLPAPRESDEEHVKKRLYRAELVVEERAALLDEEVENRVSRIGDSVAIGHALAGKTVEQAGIANPVGFELTALRRTDGSTPEVSPSLVLQAGDVLTFTTDTDALPALWTPIGLKPFYAPVEMKTPRHTHRLVEVVVSRQYVGVGRHISELPLRVDPHQAMIVAVSRNGEPPAGPIEDARIEAGDNAVLEVNDSFFYDSRNETDFLILKRLRGYRVQRTNRAVVATLLTVAMVVVAAVGWVSVLNAALLGALAMLLTGCMTVRQAAQSVEFDTVVVLGAAVGLESAIRASGLSDVIADLLMSLGGDNPYVALAVVFLGCVVMTNLITNAAAAAFMFPIAVSMAAQLNVNFMPFVVILMLGSPYAFINPAAYQTNLMVYEPGGYSFGDFAKVGLPLTVIAGTVVVLLAPVVYGF